MELLEKVAVDRPGYTFQKTAANLECNSQKFMLVQNTEIAEVLAHLAEAYRRIGNLKKAIQLFWESFQFWRRMGNYSRMCWCLWGVASIERTKGEMHDSYHHFSQALTLARGAGERRCQAWSFAEMAEILRIIGDYRHAMPAHLEILREFKVLKDFTGMAWAHSGIAQMLRLYGKLKAAERSFLLAEHSSLVIEDFVGAGWALRGQAEIANHRRDFFSAIRHANSALDYFIRKGYPIGIAYTKKTLAEAHLGVGHTSEAFSVAISAQLAFEAARETRGIAYGLKTLADIEASAGLITQAMEHYQAAQDILIRLRIRIPDIFSPSLTMARLAQVLQNKRSFSSLTQQRSAL